MKTQAQLEENRKIMRHGEQMRLAREVPAPPAAGDLDLEDVRKADFFFS